MDIKPTVGRVVHYWVGGAPRGQIPPPQPQAAIIAYVHPGERHIAIAWFDSLGQARNESFVPLWDGEGDQPDGPHCAWMPYQKGQAAKTEQLEQRLRDGVGYRESIDNGDRHT
jgi:hypothetical protein